MQYIPHRIMGDVLYSNTYTVLLIFIVFTLKTCLYHSSIDIRVKRLTSLSVYKTHIALPLLYPLIFFRNILFPSHL